MCLLSYQGIWCALHWISGPLNTEIHKHNTDSSCIKQPFSIVRVICPYIEFGWLNQYFWISLGLATALSAFHPSTLLAVLIEIELNVNVFALDSPQTMFFAVFHLLFSFGLSSTKTIEQKKLKRRKKGFCTTVMFLMNTSLHFKCMAVDCLLLPLYTYCIYTIK